MGKFLKTVILGGLSGAAAAYFLTSKKGKELQGKVSDFVTDYQENPADYNQLIKDKTLDYKEKAVANFNHYKEQWESGELTKEDVLEAVKDRAGQLVTTVNEVKGQAKETLEQADQAVELPEVGGIVDDIVIDYVEDLDETTK